MSKPSQQKPSDASFDDALQLVRRSFMRLTCAIGSGDYFDAWLAAVQFRVTTDQATRIARQTSIPTHRLDGMLVIAEPMLAIAPSPSSSEIRKLRTADAREDRQRWKEIEQQWWCSVREQLSAAVFKGDHDGESAQSGKEYGDNVDHGRCPYPDRKRVPEPASSTGNRAATRQGHWA